MPFYSSALLEQVRSANDILEVIGAVLPLKKAGASYTALCPFHKEKTPSFHVNPHSQFFHCFGCNKGGDVFRFIQEYENLPFVAAVQRLAERAKIPLVSEKGEEAKLHRKDLLLRVHEAVAEKWHRALLEDGAAKPAREYLAARQISAEAIAQFQLGYSADSWDDLLRWGEAKKFSATLLEEAGLALPKENGAGYYDRFRGRLMFPIHDDQGRVVGFSGRSLNPEEKGAKYINSPETLLFTKGRIIYGLDKAKRELLNAQHAIICEGQLDLITCHMAGIRNVVAPQGTALTSDHARILKRYVNEVVLCFDGDAAGQKAAVRALDDLLAAGLSIRVAPIPEPHDPDSFIKKAGPDAFREVIKNATGFFDFYLQRLLLLHDRNTDSGQKEIVRAMGESLRKTNDPVLYERYAQKTALQLGVSSAAILAAFQRSVRQAHAPKRAVESENKTPASPRKPITSSEKFLLQVLAQNPELGEFARSHLRLEWIAHRELRAFLAACLEGDSSFHLSHEVENEDIRSLVSSALVGATRVQFTLKQFSELLQRLRNEFIDKQIAELQQKLASAPPEQAAELLGQQKQKRQERRGPLGVNG